MAGWWSGEEEREKREGAAEGEMQTHDNLGRACELADGVVLPAIGAVDHGVEDDTKGQGDEGCDAQTELRVLAYTLL